MIKYLYDYLEKKLDKDAVQNYYNEHKSEIETYDSEHVLVRITDTVTDEQALALINEILAKVNEGKTFEEIEKELQPLIILSLDNITIKEKSEKKDFLE